MSKRRRVARAFARWLVVAATSYLLVCAAAAWFKEALLFPAHGRERAAGKTAPAGYEVWWHTMRDGVRVEGWWRRAEHADGPAPTVIVFHGNGELIDDSRDFAEVWSALGANVLLAGYRGYGRSEGAPGVAECVADADEWFDRVAGRPETRAGSIIAHGYSLGGVFAAELAGRRPVAGLVMESTVASLRDAAWDRRIALILTRERFDAKAVLRALPAEVPVLLTHGRADGVVPFRHLGLLQAARPTARVVAGDHDHIPLSTQSRVDLLRELLAEVRSREPLR